MDIIIDCFIWMKSDWIAIHHGWNPTAKHIPATHISFCFYELLYVVSGRTKNHSPTPSIPFKSKCFADKIDPKFLRFFVSSSGNTWQLFPRIFTYVTISSAALSNDESVTKSSNVEWWHEANPALDRQYSNLHNALKRLGSSFFSWNISHNVLSVQGLWNNPATTKKLRILRKQWQVGLRWSPFLKSYFSNHPEKNSLLLTSIAFFSS